MVSGDEIHVLLHVVTIALLVLVLRILRGMIDVRPKVKRDLLR